MILEHKDHFILSILSIAWPTQGLLNKNNNKSILCSYDILLRPEYSQKGIVNSKDKEKFIFSLFTDLNFKQTLLTEIPDDSY